MAIGSVASDGLVRMPARPSVDEFASDVHARHLRRETVTPGRLERPESPSGRIVKVLVHADMGLGPVPFRAALWCILLTWSRYTAISFVVVVVSEVRTMLSTRLNTRSQPDQSQRTPGLCFASCLARSFLLEKPPPVACGQPSWRQKNDFVCLLWCFLRSQPLVNTALDVQPGYAQLHVPFLFGNPYALRSGELGDSERVDRAGGDLSEALVEGTPRLEAEGDLEGLLVRECGRYLESGVRVCGFMADSGGKEE